MIKNIMRLRLSIVLIGIPLLAIYFDFINFPQGVISSVLAYLGAVLNYIVVSKNNWKMPTYDFGVKKIRNEIFSNYHSKMNKDTKHIFLSDIFMVAFPKLKKDGYFVMIFSIGDIFIMLGLIYMFTGVFK
jgi:hypothetical protein